MSFESEAEELRNIASGDAMPQALLREAQTNLIDLNARAIAILGTISQHGTAVTGAVQLASAAIDDAIAAVLLFESTLHDAADGHARG